MKEVVCKISGEKFIVSDLELELRKKFGFENSLPDKKPKYRFQELGAFWPHWNLHNRTCDKTGKKIISIFRPDCDYPVWHRDEWVKHANPPHLSCHSGLDPESNDADILKQVPNENCVGNFDFSKKFFDQAWKLFQQCPLPHNFQSQNENCEYADDWYQSKNCYLCHSGQNNQDDMYCYGCDTISDSWFAGKALNSELTTDVINSDKIFDSMFIVQSKNIQNAAFLYDCRNCSDCMFCFNLRNKKYCFGNQQLTKAQFEDKKAEWNLKSQKKYTQAKVFFAEAIQKMSYFKAQDLEHHENSFGNYSTRIKNCENCYWVPNHEDCVNVAFSGPNGRTLNDSLGTVGAELSFNTSLPVFSYETRFSFSLDHGRFLDYCAYCFQCENCFGCCGLVGKKFCIFNKEYSEEEYVELKEKIIAHMKKTGEWGKFFPGKFAPNPYNESWSSFYWPLSDEKQKKFGFKTCDPLHRKPVKTAEISEIPDSVDDLDCHSEFISESNREISDQVRKDKVSTKWLLSQVFWDDVYGRPFQITMNDIKFAKKLGVPLPNCFYMNRIQENFRWMPFDGELRNCVCGQCGGAIQTSWPKKYDARILCENCYLEKIA